PGVRRRRLVGGGLLRPVGGGAASELPLVAPLVVDVRRVLRKDLPVDLGVDVLQSGLVGPDTRDEQVDLVPPVGAPEPQAVPGDRAARLQAVLLDALDAIAGPEAPPLSLGL